MPTHFAFRLSTYLTLALACLCVSYAEWTVLRPASYFGGLVLVLLGVSFWCEGRYELDVSAANRLGFLIGVVGAAWLAYQFVNRNSLIYTLPWPASLLPYLGPLLMVLMPAKLFRPKHVGDWWAMQGIGLAAAGLATAMDDDQVFAGLLACYAVAGVWSLSLFFYLRVGGLLPPIPKSDPGPAPTILASVVQVEEVKFGGAFFARTMVWVAVAFALAAPFFFLTPRSSAPRWQFGQSKLETGLSNEKLSDLNNTGDLTVSREAVYEFHAADRHGVALTDLSPEQRFRSFAFNTYDAGRWQNANTEPLLATTARLVLDDRQPAPTVDLGPDQVEFIFSQKVRTFDLILADPIAWRVGAPAPMTTLIDSRVLPWFQQTDGTFRPRQAPPSKAAFPPYRQLTRFNADADRDLGSPFELAQPFWSAGQAPSSPDNPLLKYRAHGLPRLQAWARELFTRMATWDAPIAEALKRATPAPAFEFAPQDYELVARRLADHFAMSREYRYTLKLRRLNAASDPVEEFLFTTKEGHCERFAAAVALVLRTVGVPTLYVLGYKGCEHDGDGLYTIRQENAHAWVEVLVPRPAPPRLPFRNAPDLVDGKPVVWHWLSVDPTPGGSEEAVTSAATGFNTAWDSVKIFFADFVIGYNADRRNQAVQSFLGWLIRGKGGHLLFGLVLVALTVVALMAARRRRARGRAATTSGFPWFDQFLTAARRHSPGEGLGQTPRELAARLTKQLRSDVPREVVEAFYKARYGGAAPDAAETARLTALVRDFETSRPAGV